jgi:cobaltochelatase CobN
MYETYVADRNDLQIEQRFRAAQNLLAYQAMVDKMLVAINKGYWQADAAVKQVLEQLDRRLIAEVGAACDEHSCSSPEVTALAQEQDRQILRQALSQPAPSTQAAPAQASAATLVEAASAAASTSQGESGAPTKQMPESAPPATQASEQDVAEAAQQVSGFEMEQQVRQSLQHVAMPLALSWAAVIFALLVLVGFVSREWQTRSFRGAAPLTRHA